MLACGSGVGVKDIQMLCDTEFGWKAAPDQESQDLRISPVNCSGLVQVLVLALVLVC